MTSWGTTCPMERIRSWPPVVEQPIHLRGPVVGELALGHLTDEIPGKTTQGLQVVLPLMDPEELLRHLAEHGLPFLVGDREVGAQGGEHVGQGVAVVFPRELRDPAGAGMEAGEIGRHRNHARSLSQLRQRLEEACSQLGIGKGTALGAAAVIQHRYILQEGVSGSEASNSSMSFFS